MMSLYKIKVRDMDDKEVELSQYSGKVLLIINTATSCGFTPQYDGLQDLYEKYADDGFLILDFPCNQFGEQAPGTTAEIHSFCTGRFGVTFPQFAKINVNGENESPLYTFLKKQKGGLFGDAIKWNFTKFLVDRNGNVVERYAPTSKPEGLAKDISKLLEVK